MKRVLVILMAMMTVWSSATSAFTRADLAKRSLYELLPLYYGDLDRWRDPFDTDLNRQAVREELVLRADLTDTLMKAFLERHVGDRYLYDSILGLGEFGKPSEEQHQLILSAIKAVWAKMPQSHAPEAHALTFDSGVLVGMGSYLAGHPSAEGEPILLELLRDGDFYYGFPFTLRMVERYPTPARLDALRSRGDGTVFNGSMRAIMRGWINASISRIEANLKAQGPPQKPPLSESEPSPVGEPANTTTSGGSQRGAVNEGAHQTHLSSRVGSFWLVASVIAGLLVIGLWLQKRSA